MKLDEPNVAQPDYESELIPKGWYPVKVLKDKKRHTKARDGSWYLRVYVEITGGEHEGFELFTDLHLKNKSDLAVEIAQRQFNELQCACGFAGKPVKDTSVFYGNRVWAYIEIDEGSNGYPDKNRVTKWRMHKDHEKDELVDESPRPWEKDDYDEDELAF